MADRPVFLARTDSSIGVSTKSISFEWFPGFSVSQKQKSIQSLHVAASANGIDKILEISSKSPLPIGEELSAFNLKIETKKYKKVFSVECAFQASKVFDNGGPYVDLLAKTSREAKKDPRIKNSGRLKKFVFFNEEFELVPRTMFYDWLYINALSKNKKLSAEVLQYEAFTDIEFNPSKSINCQAFSAALYVSLVNSNKLSNALKSSNDFKAVVLDSYRSDESGLFQKISHM